LISVVQNSGSKFQSRDLKSSQKDLLAPNNKNQQIGSWFR